MRPDAEEWEDIGTGGMIDDLYYLMRHKPCGTTLQILAGHKCICPECQPEEYERQRKTA